MNMQRIMVFDRTDAYRFDIDPLQVLDATSKEEVNGEHSLTITTLQELEKTNRLLLQDGMGTWHEYVVLGIEEKHAAGGAIQHEYYCVWSLQYDLSATYINDQFGCGVVPGHASVPQPARRGLECALEGTERWSIGTITVTAQASASFYRRSGWEGLQTVVERWGGSLAATITVGTAGVTGRAVDLLEHEGKEAPTRRFDYGADVTGIKRVVSDDVWPCRIVPLGKSMETDEGGYTRRPDITSVNGGVPWLQDADATPLVRVPDGSGGWEYPTAIIKNDTYEQPADLLAWATDHLSDYTRPIVTYEADVAQFERAGLSAHGVALGDEVVVVDRTFGAAGLRISARVIRIEASLLDPTKQKLTIGNAQSTLAGQLSELATSVAALAGEVANGSEWRTSSAYMDAIIGRLNDEINATGGYWYIVPGYGTRTYDVPVSDPAVGSEASAVVEVRGGTIRIANSRTSSGDWDWKTVFTSGHIAAEMITAIRVNAGYIGSPTSGAYWDLDQGILEVKDAGGNVVFSADSTGVFLTGDLQLTKTARYYTSTSQSSATYTIDILAGVYTTSDDNLKERLTGSVSQAEAGKEVNIPLMMLDMSNVTGTKGDTVYVVPHTTRSTNLTSVLSYSAIASTGHLGIIAQLNESSFPRILMEKNNLDIGFGTSMSDGGYIRFTNTAITSSKTITTSSDRRIKRHEAYLGDEAAEFVRALRPVLYEMDGEEHVGFYAQDVEGADQWGGVFVTESDTGQLGEGVPVKQLDYQALIAPLVRYCQRLEERIAALEGREP